MTLPVLPVMVVSSYLAGWGVVVGYSGVVGILGLGAFWWSWGVFLGVWVVCSGGGLFARRRSLPFGPPLGWKVDYGPDFRAEQGKKGHQ